MKRTMSALIMASALGGCMSSNTTPDVSTKPTVRASGDYVAQSLPGVSGPWGEPIPMAAPYSATHITPWQARSMMSQSVPLSWVQMDQGVVQAGAQMPAGGMPPYGMPMMPGGMITPPGTPMVPPMGGPGGMGMPNMQMPNGYGGMPGRVTPASLTSRSIPPPAGAVAAAGAMTGGGGMPSTSLGRTQIRFTGPDGMKIAWLTQGSGPDCQASFSAPVVEAPGRYNFLQASIYRLKLTNIRSRPGLEVYPTLEIVPCNPKTAAFLAHSAVPLEFTPQDFQEISEGKFLVKVIYLPDPQYQELAATGTDEIISTRLEPGADPILEAQRRGSILAVIRMGNVDQEAPNTPPLDGSGPLCIGAAPAGMGPQGMMPPGMMAQGMMPPGMQSQAMMSQGMMPQGMMPVPPRTGPAMSVPAMPTSRVPASPPVPMGPISKGPSNSTIQTVSTLPAMPEMPPAQTKTAAPMPPAPPALPAQSSVNLPPPPMPQTPAERAAQSDQ